MKTVRIETTWRATVDVDVPDDFTLPDVLGGFPDDVLEQMTTLGAELTDWNLA